MRCKRYEFAEMQVKNETVYCPHPTSLSLGHPPHRGGHLLNKPKFDVSFPHHITKKILRKAVVEEWAERWYDRGKDVVKWIM